MNGMPNTAKSFINRVQAYPPCTLHFNRVNLLYASCDEFVQVQEQLQIDIYRQNTNHSLE
uniref:Uncharacterized protein n=1 Tax=Anguilla anguilla TaxID=7936 RepID=A0A0E9WIB0_ANGAN